MATLKVLSDRPVVTIIVAVLNDVKRLQCCINSVVGQAYPSKQLIIMDGGSTDGTVEFLKSNTENILYWESEPDRGIFHAWNKALDRAKGEWVCFLGADDYFATRDSLSTLVSGLKPRADFVFGRTALVDEKGRVLKFEGVPWDWKKMKRVQAIAHPATLHHRSVFNRYGKFDEKYKIAGDYEFFLRVGSSARSSYVSDVVVHCRAGGASRSQLRRVLKESREIHSAHPEIGPYRAWKNYCISAPRSILRRSLYGF